MEFIETSKHDTLQGKIKRSAYIYITDNSRYLIMQPQMWRVKFVSGGLNNWIRG